MNYIYQEFKKKYSDILSAAKADFSNKRYTLTELLFLKYYTAILHAQQNNLKNGLEFGPGTCAGLVIAKIMDVKLTGLDIRSPKDDSFNRVHNEMIKKKYDLIICDTNSFPWPIISTFDFLLAFDSLLIDWKTQADWKSDLFFFEIGIKNRLNEIFKLMQNGGFLYIGGGGINKTKEYNSLICFLKTFNIDIRNCEILNWEMNKIYNENHALVIKTQLDNAGKSIL